MARGAHRCVEEYKLAPDGKSCLMLSDICEGPKCLKSDAKFNDTLFGEMLHGYNNRSQHVNQGQVFQMTFRYGPAPRLVLGTSGWADGTKLTGPSTETAALTRSLPDTRGGEQGDTKPLGFSHSFILPAGSSVGLSCGVGVCLLGRGLIVLDGLFPASLSRLFPDLPSPHLAMSSTVCSTVAWKSISLCMFAACASKLYSVPES